MRCAFNWLDSFNVEKISEIVQSVNISLRDKITFPSEPLIAFWTVYFLLLTCESASFFVWLSMCQLWYMMFVVDVCKHAH